MRFERERPGHRQQHHPQAAPVRVGVARRETPRRHHLHHPERDVHQRPQYADHPARVVGQIVLAGQAVTHELHWTFSAWARAGRSARAHPASTASRSRTAPFRIATAAAYARIVSAGGDSGPSPARGSAGSASAGAGHGISCSTGTCTISGRTVGAGPAPAAHPASANAPVASIALAPRALFINARGAPLRSRLWPLRVALLVDSRDFIAVCLFHCFTDTRIDRFF